MKRSKRIDLHAMRKTLPALKPLPLAIVVAVSITACSGKEEARVYNSVEECHTDNPGLLAQCNKAHQYANNQALRTAPTYTSKRECEAEFGTTACKQKSGTQFFIPVMAGFMLATAVQNGIYRSNPVYTSYSNRSSLYGGWYGSDGTRYGDSSSRRVRADSSAFDPKPQATRTMSRGGFGSIARAKSSWGSGSRSSFGS